MSFSVIRHKDTHQTHVIMGCRAMSARHPDRYAMHLLNNILGGPAITARLNVSLRERAGLVYTVQSIYASYPEEGLWEVYFGCDPKDTARCRRLVERELRRIIEKPLTPRQLLAAKKQYKGQVGIARSNRENYAVSLGRSYAMYGHMLPLKELHARIDAVSAEDLQRVAAEYLQPETLSILIYTPDEKDSALPH